MLQSPVYQDFALKQLLLSLEYFIHSIKLSLNVLDLLNGFSLKTERKVLQSSAEVQLSKRLTLLLFLKYLSFHTEQPFIFFKLPTVL